jgi:hypothetical protein
MSTRRRSLAPFKLLLPALCRLVLSRDLSRVERLEVLASALPSFDEPTLGVVAGQHFYFVANSQWGAIGDDGQLAPPGKLREHVIPKLKL